MMRRFGLIGFPLSHSFSQKYFTEKFANLGITDCVYENFALKHIDELAELITKHSDIAGLNVTIPYKKQVLDFLTDTTEVVTKTGACNCIKFQGSRLTGHNTDVTGFEQSLLPFLKPHHTRALVFGTGGASAAVAYVLDKLGIPFQYVSRNTADHTMDYQSVNESLLASHQLLINTTPLGMYPAVDEFPDIPYQYLTPQHHLYDLIYNPAQTKFLEKGKLRGATTQNGLEMLILQAEESWRIWNTDK
jgi:shikimate dehydrogenase